MKKKLFILSIIIVFFLTNISLVLYYALTIGIRNLITFNLFGKSFLATFTVIYLVLTTIYTVIITIDIKKKCDFIKIGDSIVFFIIYLPVLLYCVGYFVVLP